MGINEEKKANLLNESELEGVSGGAGDWRMDQTRAISKETDRAIADKNGVTRRKKDGKASDNAGPFFG